MVEVKTGHESTGVLCMGKAVWDQVGPCGWDQQWSLTELVKVPGQCF